MDAITSGNSQPHLQRSRWREPSGGLLCSFSRSSLILFALVALASTAQAGGQVANCQPPPCRTNQIVGVTNCTCTNLTIQLSHFCQGPLVAHCGGVVLNGTYNCANQTYTAPRPAGLSPGTCLLTISKCGECLASTNVLVCDCV